MKKSKKSSLPKLHKTQWQILKDMTTREASRFNELKPKEMDPKQFTYHLKKLVSMNLVDYDDQKSNYILSDSGKLLISYFEKHPDFEEFPLDSYILLYIKRNKDLLVVKRKVQPYLDYIGVLSTYIKKNEFIEVSANKRLESIGLAGKAKLAMIIEVLYKTKDNTIREHACMYTYYVKNPSGNITQKYNEGELSWIEPKELLKVKKGYDNSKDLIKHFESKNFNPKELKTISREYYTKW
jgi:hypothetical protein